MAITANPPPGLRKLPKQWFNDPEVRSWAQHLVLLVTQTWERTGGGDDAVSEVQLGELYEPGIQLFNEDDIESLIEEPPIQQFDLGMIQDVLDQDHAIVHGLLERVRELEVDSAMAPIQASKELERVEITADFTTTGDQAVICNNSSSITVTLNASPDDGEEVQIKRRNALVTISGTIDGSSTSTLTVRYDVVRLNYLASADEWMVM